MSNTLIRIDRSVKLTYPDYMKEVVHPDLEGVGPAEYDMTQVKLLVHDDQKYGGQTKGEKIYEYLKAIDVLKECLCFKDALAIKGSRIVAFRKAFGNDVVVCWRSVMRDHDGCLYAPIVYGEDNWVIMRWLFLGEVFYSNFLAGCYPGVVGNRVLRTDAVGSPLSGNFGP